jgi:hypothetical protein
MLPHGPARSPSPMEYVIIHSKSPVPPVSAHECSIRCPQVLRPSNRPNFSSLQLRANSQQSFPYRAPRLQRLLYPYPPKLFRVLESLCYPNYPRQSKKICPIRPHLLPGARDVL